MKAKVLLVMASALIAACSSAPASDSASSDPQYAPDDPDAARSGRFGGGETASDAAYAQPDAAAHDAAKKVYADVTAPLVCPQPADVSAFVPGTPTPPHSTDKTACQSGDYQGYYDACYGNAATISTCAAWEQARQKCRACLESQYGDPQWGVLVTRNNVVTLNVAGCLKLVGEGNCAAAYAADVMCVAAACDVQCPVTDTPSFQKYAQCVTSAQSGGCKKYSDASDAACAPNVAPNAARCDASGFLNVLLKIGPVFCGP